MIVRRQFQKYSEPYVGRCLHTFGRNAVSRSHNNNCLRAHWFVCSFILMSIIIITIVVVVVVIVIDTPNRTYTIIHECTRWLGFRLIASYYKSSAVVRFRWKGIPFLLFAMRSNVFSLLTTVSSVCVWRDAILNFLKTKTNVPPPYHVGSEWFGSQMPFTWHEYDTLLDTFNTT